MIDREDIIKAVEKELQDGALFLVDVKMSAGDEIEIFIDSDGLEADGHPRRVTVDDCVALNKAIEAWFDRDVEDFSLTVSSAGVGQPLKVPRQYKKLVGRQVEVVLTVGAKIVATLEAVDENGNMTLSYPEKQKAEGKKRHEIVSKTALFTPHDVKKTTEYIDFK